MTIALALLLALQEIPDHPDKLKFKPLRFEVPDAAAMRATLSTGTPAWLIPDDALPIVDLQILVRGGSFQEPPGKEGLADLTADLMRTGGTKSRHPDALDEELDFLAADLSLSMGDTSGSIRLSVLSKDLDRGLEILFDVLRHPAWNAEKLATIKEQTLDGMKARNDSTAAIEAREAGLLFYGDFPTNRLSTKTSLESITREDLAAFHASTFHPSRFLIAAAGAFNRDDLVRKLEAGFKDWPKSTGKPLEIPKVAHRPKPGIYCFHKEGKNVNQGRVTMGHMGVDVHHPDGPALRVMSYILGAGGFSSRLMLKVRTQEGLAYDVRSDCRPGPLYPWPFKILFQSKSESVAYAAKLCLEEARKIQDQEVTAKELEDAVRFFLDGFPAFFFATKSQTAATYATAELQGLPKDFYATWREKIAAVSAADVRRVAREHLKPSQFAWVVVGNIPAIKAADEKHGVKLADLGEVTDVPLADPFTLERPR